MKQFDHHPLLESVDIKQVTLDTGRYYVMPDGREYPSVTTILKMLDKPGLDAWRERVGEVEANRVASVAAQRGKALHESVEKYLKNESNYVSHDDPIAWANFSQIQSMLDEIEIVHAIEAPIWSEFLRVAGQTDLAGVFRGKRSIIDLKTSTSQKREEWITGYFLQATMYAIMMEERTGLSFPQIVLIVSVQNDLPQLFVRRRIEYEDQAVALVGAWYGQKGHGDGDTSLLRGV